MVDINTYYIEQKLVSLADTYYIYDSSNNLYLTVSTRGVSPIFNRFFGSIFSIGHNFYIKELDGREFCTIKKRTAFFLGKYDVYFDNKYLASIKQKMKFKPEISIVSSEKSYKLSGDIMGRDFIIRGEKAAARISKKRFNIKDRYKIDIFEENSNKLFIAAVIALDNSIHN